MIRRFLRWGMAAVLMTALAFTSFVPQPAVSSEEEVLNLTMDQALKLAEENNPDIKLAAIAKEAKRLSLSQAKDQARSLKNATRPADKAPMTWEYDRAAGMYVTPVVAQKTYDYAILDYEMAVKGVKISVTKAYYDVQSAQSTLTLKRESLTRSQEALKMVEAKYKVGTAAKLEVDQQRVTVASAEAEAAAAEQALQEAVLAFNKVLVLPIEQGINLTSVAEIKDFQVNYEEALEKAFSEDQTLRQAELKLFEAELAFKTLNQYFPGTDGWKSADQGYQSASLSYEKAKYDTNIKVLSAYNSLQSAKRQYEILASQVKVAEETTRLTKLRYQVGMATLYDVNTSSTQLEEIKQQYQSAVFGYNLAVSQFEYGVFQ